MRSLSLSGWTQPADALLDVAPDALTFDYSDYASVEASFEGLREFADVEHVIGWSLGGQLALRAIMAGVLKPQRLTLIAAPVQFVSSLSSPLEGEPNPKGFGGGYGPNLITNARTMRKQMTPWEFVLWERLKQQQLGYKFRRQQPIGPYIVDFLNSEKKLVIELDGSQHMGSERDRVRDEYLVKAGYRITRFWNNEVDLNIDGVLLRILDMLEAPPTDVQGHIPLPLEGGAKVKGMDPITFAQFRDSYARDAGRTALRFHALVAKGDARAKEISKELRDHDHVTDTARWLPWLDVLGADSLVGKDMSMVPPTLLVHGATDGVVRVEQSELLTTMLPQAHLNIWDQTAHAPHLHDTARLRGEINAYHFQREAA